MNTRMYMSDKEFAEWATQTMREIAKNQRDYEVSHSEADDLLNLVARRFVGNEISDIFQSMKRRCA